MDRESVNLSPPDVVRYVYTQTQMYTHMQSI